MFRARRILPVLPAVVILALDASGCGGGGKEQVTAAELVQKADGICRTEQIKFDQIQAHPPANASIAADQTKELIDVSRAATSDLRDLEPPDSLTTPYDRYLESRDSAVDEMGRGQDAADDQNSAGYAAAQTAVAKNASRRSQLARAVGLKVCGSNPRSG
jgi:hypothetical protein